MLRIRLHGRGGQGTKTAGSIISLAATLGGYHAQDSPMYGPERRGAPVASFVRISRSQVNERGYIVSPDVVVLFDRSLRDSHAADPLSGLRQSGVLVVNESPGGVQGSVVRIDASSLARRLVGRDNISAAMAAATCKALRISSLESVLSAVRTELGEIGLAEQDVEKNLELTRECYGATPEFGLAQDDDSLEAETPLVEIQYRPPGVSTSFIMSTGNSLLKKTGLWRTSRPVIDYAKCTNCMVCFVYCPDSAISLEADLTPRIDYDNCKGCMVCLTECPIRAIAEVVP